MIAFEDVLYKVITITTFFLFWMLILKKKTLTNVKLY